MKNFFFSMLVAILPVTTFLNPVEHLPNAVYQSRSIKAYINHQGQWHTGYIYYEPQQNGIRLTNYQFDTMYTVNGQSFSGNLGGNERFVPLNQNNNLARTYNFTHYLDLQGVRAYIISN